VKIPQADLCTGSLLTDYPPRLSLLGIMTPRPSDAAYQCGYYGAPAALGITVLQPNEAIGVEAARLRQRHPISLPDAYCLATAKHTSSTVSSFTQKILKADAREGIKVA
jgi:predicted nucleic acid-binding protein